MDRDRAQWLWNIQAAEESNRDAEEHSSATATIAVIAFLVLVVAWAVDQVLIQLQIWYHEAAAWASEALQTVASFWPF